MVGPTAVGKSALAIDLALALEGEIVVADSRQVYRRLEIATNKPSPRDRGRVRYHCLDLADPEGTFNVHQFVEAAGAAILEIAGRGRRPIVEGGSGLYVDALLDGLALGGFPPRPERRAELARQSLSELGDLLRRLDPEARVDLANRVRVERAIELLEAAGPPLERLRTRRPPPWESIRVGLDRPLPELDARIRQRCEDQLARGLVDETRRALAAGVAPDSQALTGTGYADAVRFLQGRLTLAELPEAMAQSNRQLARRQLRWFRRDRRVRWFDVGSDALPDILEYVR